MSGDRPDKSRKEGTDSRIGEVLKEIYEKFILKEFFWPIREHPRTMKEAFRRRNVEKIFIEEKKFYLNKIGGEDLEYYILKELKKRKYIIPEKYPFLEVESETS